ncbi:MAG: anaerobic glycerol-3-phosphate dehydrogenase subunit A [Promethearchaeota archaeon]
MQLIQDFDAIIVGGGICGTGIARDLALRGIRIALFEKRDLAEGTTGRCHGLLHSGARYVSTDPEVAKECAQENLILRRTAAHIIDSVGGYFVGITDEDLNYGKKFPEMCQNAGVDIEEIPIKEFLQHEPNCNPNIRKVFRTNDAYVDPFLLTLYNALDAKNHGAEIHTYSKVEHLILTEKEIVGIRVHDLLSDEFFNVYAKWIINATGPWASILERDIKPEHPLEIAPTRGTLLIFKNRLVSSVINRLQPPSTGDIIVPSHQSVIVGTNAIPIPDRELDQPKVTYEEIDTLQHLGEELIPVLKSTRLIRYYTGVRPLIKRKESPYTSSRQFSIIDYSSEGFSGLITVFGGKLTTYRLIAEKVGDLICQKLGNYKPCLTKEKLLPGADSPFTKEELQKLFQVDPRHAADLSLKWGSFIQEMGELCAKCLDTAIVDTQSKIVCECEQVSESELSWVRENLFVKKIDDYRRRTRQGMGVCQGQFCYFKVAELELLWSQKSHTKIMEELKEALEKRWKTEDLVDEAQRRQIKLAKYMYILGGNLS